MDIGAQFLALFPHPSYLMWALFGIILLYTLVHAAIFAYHWNTYNIAPKSFLVRTYTTYFVGITVFLFLLLSSTMAIVQ